MISKKVMAGISLAALTLPMASFAQPSNGAGPGMQAQSLMAQIQALQLQLKSHMASSTMPMKHEEASRPLGQMKERMASSTMPMKPKGEHMENDKMRKGACVMLKRDLRMGARGDDVKKLQEMLAQDPESGFSGQATGLFGPLTAKAMAKFQMKSGIASTTDGSIGKMTRAFFERECKKGPDMEMPGMRGSELGGTITASTNSSITVQNKEGVSRVITISSTTNIQVFATASSTPTMGTIADLVVGKMVRAVGVPQADQSLVAHMIKVGIRE